jgi:hypothetical protein
VYSGGTVWRRDPDLAPRIEAFERGRIEAETERIGLLGTAVLNREIYAALHGFFANNGYKLDDDLRPYKAAGAVGFRDRSGATVIDPRFNDALGGFSEGLAAAAMKVKGRMRWGFIDRAGAWVITPRYDRVTDFTEGLAGAEEDGRAGFIDKSGAFIIQPVFDRVSAFRMGVAEVWINDKAGFYDRSARKLFSPP